ncbi:hypothetical protein [uncultured Veillonella sp.]|uniref:hypothetical protein n=1 Tax=uncultured Veillonella sp. TaxID=159268 RepID=UPI00265D6D20|nr:hypothetical protein [uncultured Veillonella sp.]
MFDNPWQFCVAIILIIWGTYYIAYRFWCRQKGIPVEILSIKPRVIKELPNFTVIYGYDVIYLLNGLEYTAKSLEFYVTVLVPGPMIPYSTTGKLLHNGKVSLDKVKTNTIYGVVLWVFAIIFLAELY